MGAPARKKEEETRRLSDRTTFFFGGGPSLVIQGLLKNNTILREPYGTTIVNRVTSWVIWDNGKEHGNYYLGLFPPVPPFSFTLMPLRLVSCLESLLWMFLSCL